MAAAAVADEAPPVASGAQYLKGLRSKARNTLFISGSIMAKDRMQALLRMHFAVLEPLFTEHSSEAADIRAPDDTLRHYVRAAQGQYHRTFDLTLLATQRPQKLQSYGLSTDTSTFPPVGSLDDGDPRLESEDFLARPAHDLACAIILRRQSSLAWHSDGWPGLLALFASSDQATREAARALLLEDYRHFEALKLLALGNSFYQRIVNLSPFKTTLVAEIAARIREASDSEQKATLTLTSEICTLLFSGWGQTKVIEDVLGTLRDRECRDSKSKAFHLLRQLAVMVDSDGLGNHHRGDIALDPLAQVRTPKLREFQAKFMQPQVSLSDITKRATWPTLSALSSQATYLAQAMLRWCARQGKLDKMHRLWKTELLQPRSVLKDRDGKHDFFLGSCNVGLAGVA